MRDYRKIMAWQKADDLTVAVYEATKTFPKDEVYSLTSQIRRAAYSIPANIAEGASRNSQKDYLHFLYISRGSAAEVGYFIHLSRRLGYINQEDHESLAAQAAEASRILTGLIQSVEKETGVLARAAAKITSAFILFLGSAFLRSSVYSLRSPV